MTINADKLFEEWRKADKEANKLTAQTRTHIQKTEEYKKLQTDIGLMETYLTLAKKQKRLMNKNFETKETREAKELVREIWIKFTEARQKETNDQDRFAKWERLLNDQKKK